MKTYKWKTPLGIAEASTLVGGNTNSILFYVLKGFDKDLYEASQKVLELETQLVDLKIQHQQEVLDLKIKYLEVLEKYTSTTI